MLRTYGPGCDGSLIEAGGSSIPDAATWIDLELPTHEEEQLVERCIGVGVPTQDNSPRSSRRAACSSGVARFT